MVKGNIVFVIDDVGLYTDDEKSFFIENSSISLLCYCNRERHLFIINVIIAGDFTTVIAVHFHDFRKIVINGVELKTVMVTTFDSIQQSFTGSAGPENKFIPIMFPFFRYLISA